MAAVTVMIDGVIWDKALKAGRAVTLMGQAWLPDLSVGGGPVYPEQPPGGGGQPPGIWGPTDPRPTPPIAEPPGGWGGQPPGIWGPPGPWPTPPIHLPPEGVEIPPPGSPPVVIGGTQPVQPIQPPPAIVVDYPGIGKVLVPKPETNA